MAYLAKNLDKDKGLVDDYRKALQCHVEKNKLCMRTKLNRADSPLSTVQKVLWLVMWMFPMSSSGLSVQVTDRYISKENLERL